MPLKIPAYQDLWQIFRFGIVGIVATLVHMGVATLLSMTTEIPLVLINTLAFLVAFGFSFCGHYYWTFSRQSEYGRSLVRFFLVALTGLLASTLLLSVLIKLDFANDVTKLVISIVIIPVVTYYMGKLWAFRAKEI